jgi:F-type H+-transporting ATPase subunit epsilon
MGFHLSIVTPAASVVETEADLLVAPGQEGEFGVLPGHEPYLIPLAAGVVRYQSGGTTHRVAVTGGFAEVTQDRVTVLARTAEPVGAIDRARAEAARDHAEQAIRDAGPLAPPEKIEELRDAVARANARLAALQN